MLCRPPLLNVVRQGSQGRKDTLVVLVVGLELHPVALGHLERQFECIDGIETQSGTKQCSIRVDALRLDALEVQRGNDQFGKFRCSGVCNAAMLILGTRAREIQIFSECIMRSEASR